VLYLVSQTNNLLVKQILQLHRSFLFEHTGIKQLAGYLLFVFFICLLNYHSPLSAWQHSGATVIFFGYFLLFVMALVYGFIIENIFRLQKTGILLLATALLFACKIVFPANWLCSLWFDGEAALLWTPVVYWLGNAVFITFCVGVIYYIKEKRFGLYGFRKLKQSGMYCFFILLMVPLLLLAAQQNDFQQVYPKAQVLGSGAAFAQYAVFELAYAVDFFTIELFFRGFLVFALGRHFGVKCILPVALFYFTIHLGKPMAEAISSFFGGAVLGLIAYNTKSIWGGWFVHVSIALLMELFGFIF
jgi:membrane protease YdiL (CAAX protease family)